jgi:hypothetical protein
MNHIEVMRQALEALEELHRTGDTQVFDLCYAPKVIPALRTAIETAEKQEPSYYGLTNDHLWMSVSKEQYGKLKPAFRMACYTTPPAAAPVQPEQKPLMEPEGRCKECLTYNGHQDGCSHATPPAAPVQKGS